MQNVPAGPGPTRVSKTAAHHRARDEADERADERADGSPLRAVSEIARSQCGVITASQARDAGISRATVRARLESGRWQGLCTGIYATFSGPLPHHTLLWTAVLLGGPGAALSHETAAELDGLIAPTDRWAYDLDGRFDRGSDRRAGDRFIDGAAGTAAWAVHVTVPRGRVVRAHTGELPLRLVFHRSRRTGLRHPVRLPPRTRIEDTVLDLTQRAPALDQAIGWPAAGCQRRLTTPTRLLAAMNERPRLRWRHELREALGDIVAGSHSLLELRFIRRVARAHGLPVGRRQARKVRRGLVQYNDVEYEDHGVVVELDGGLAHPDQDRSRDRTRDNITVEHGGVVVRYGWGDVSERACETAAQLGRILARRGWTGRPHSCGQAGCPL